ncbi:MAG TPA: hypothetical protein VK607_13245, partial [Kofleriaceae bacterium]|nr:hypothetical protein [Kofleriaceae bacterium]
PDHRYTWTLGVDLMGAGGQMGEQNVYASAGVGVRVKADYMLLPVQRIGMEAYFQLTQLSPGNNDTMFSASLDMFDVGLAGYKDICLGTPRLCITPLLGAHLALMSPQGDQDIGGTDVFSYAGVGARAQLAFSFAFGRRYEHVLSAMAGFNAYTKALSGPDASSGNFTAEEVGLGTGGVLAFLGLGYTYRFNTPIGSSPFIILE